VRVWTRLALACSLIATIGVALAADDPILQRKKIMQDNGRTESKVLQLVLGKYFPDKAAALMQRLQANMTLFPTLFSAGTDTGGGTNASPAVWSNMEDFKALAASFVESAAVAEAAALKGQDALNVAWQEVQARCPACHEIYSLGQGM